MKKHKVMKIKVCPVCGGPMKEFHKKTCSKPCAMILRWDNPNALWRNKEWLEQQYFQNGLSFRSISKLTNCTDKNVEHFFKKFGFKSRPISEPGELSHNWKGGKVRNSQGYILVFHSEPHAYKNKGSQYVREHVLVMEKILGRPLKHPEMIHHKNGIPHDNRPQNLQLMSGPFEHNTLEQKLGKFAKLLLFGDVAPHINKEATKAFNKFLSSSVKER